MGLAADCHLPTWPNTQRHKQRPHSNRRVSLLAAAAQSVMTRRLVPGRHDTIERRQCSQTTPMPMGQHTHTTSGPLDLPSPAYRVWWARRHICGAQESPHTSPQRQETSPPICHHTLVVCPHARRVGSAAVRCCCLAVRDQPALRPVRETVQRT